MDRQTTLALYASATLTASATKALQSPRANVLSQILQNRIAANGNEGIYTVLQSAVVNEIVSYSIGELIDIGALAMQRQLSSTALSNLLNGKTGFLTTGNHFLLCELPRVTVRPDGTKELISGNHRIAAICKLAEGVPQDVLMAQQLEVLQTSVDIEALQRSLSIDGATMDVNAATKMATKFCDDLWLTANSSRSVTASEVADNNVFRSGFGKSLDDIAKALHTSSITSADAFRMALPIIAEEQIGTDEESLDASVVNADLLVAGYPVKFKADTFANLAKSIYSALVKNTKEGVKTKKAFIKGGHNAVTALANFLTSPSEYTSVQYVQSETETVTTTDGKQVPSLVAMDVYDVSLLQYAVELALAEADSNNVARNVTKIAAKLAELPEVIEYMAQYQEQPKELKSTVKTSNAATPAIWQL